MARLAPVDGDPFATQQQQPNLVPVEGNPFGAEQSAQPKLTPVAGDPFASQGQAPSDWRNKNLWDMTSQDFATARAEGESHPADPWKVAYAVAGATIDPVGTAYTQMSGQPSMTDVAMESARKGAWQGVHSASDTAKMASGQPLEQDKPDDSYVGNLLSEKMGEGWSDPNWWTAQLVHGTAASSPMLGGALIGGAAGQRVAGPRGSLVGSMLGGAGGAVLQGLGGHFKQGLQDGLPPDQAFTRAWEESGVDATIAAAFPVVSKLPLFGQIKGQLQRPIAEAIAKIAGIDPALMMANHAANTAIEGKPQSAEDLATTGLIGMGQGAAMHAAFGGNHATAVEDAAGKVAPPTDAQKEAGNYQKGHVNLHGLPITIETPRNAERSGVGPDGQPWSVQMPDHYGYIKKTEGADGDHVDTYIGPRPDLKKAFVVDQVDAETGKFDEHKVMLGYPDEASALDAYHRAFSDGKAGERIGGVSEMPVDHLKDWLKGDTTAPLAGTKVAKAGEQAARVQDIHDTVARIAARDKEYMPAGAAPKTAYISDVFDAMNRSDEPMAAVAGNYGIETLAKSGKDAPRRAIELADQLERSGKTDDQIWHATAKALEGTPYIGAFRGSDGHWRIEIDDSTTTKIGNSGRLKNVIDAPETYAAYPDLKSIKVMKPIGGLMGAFVGAGYRPAKGLSRLFGGKGTMFYSGQYAPKDVVRKMMHEIQHHIQEKEGWQNGANATTVPDWVTPEMKASLLFDERVRLRDKAKKLPPGHRQTSAADDAARLSEVDVPRLFYDRVAGEVEADAVEKRQSMTPEQRRKKPFWQDYRIPDDQHILDPRTVATPDEPMAAIAGVGAKTADMDALSEAQKMEADGVSRNNIWHDTGWFKGIDGKWRFEIDDSNATQKEAVDPKTFGDAIDHPQLFSAYPTLPNIRFKATRDGGGEFYAGGVFGRQEIAAAPWDESVMLHEGQHAIQKIEGFSSGTSPETEELRAKYGSAGLLGTARYLIDLARNRGSVHFDESAGMDAYRRNAGETESRAVEARRNLTPDQRSARPPWLDYDVPEDKQINSGSEGRKAAISGEAPRSRETNSLDDGFDTTTPYYRGTAPGFDVMQLSENGIAGRGIYVNSEADNAPSYGSKIGGTDHVVHIRGPMAGPSDVQSAIEHLRNKGGNWNQNDVNDILRAKGFTGREGFRSTDRVVFDSKDVRPLTEKAKAKVMGEGQPMFATGGQSDASVRRNLTTHIKMGLTHDVPEATVDAVHAALKPHLDILPDYYHAGVVTKVEPFRDRAYPGDDVKVTYTTHDGEERSITAPSSFLATVRAVHLGSENLVLFNRLGTLTGDVGKVLGGELRHELVHVLRQTRELSGSAWDRLVAHADKLRLLDSDLSTYLQRIGAHEAAKTAQGTLRETYEKIYAGRKNLQEAMNEEAVAHMVELYHHGELMPEEFAPVKGLLDRLVSGQFGTTTKRAGDGDRVMAAVSGNGGKGKSRLGKSMDQITEEQKGARRGVDRAIRGRSDQHQIQQTWGPKWDILMGKEYAVAEAGHDYSTMYDILSGKLSKAADIDPAMRAAMDAKREELYRDMGVEGRKAAGVSERKMVDRAIAGGGDKAAKSITSTHLISMIDGRPYKQLKRHLSQHGLTPDQYREKFGLPADYPMVHSSAIGADIAKDGKIVGREQVRADQGSGGNQKLNAFKHQLSDLAKQGKVKLIPAKVTDKASLEKAKRSAIVIDGKPVHRIVVPKGHGAGAGGGSAAPGGTGGGRMLPPPGGSGGGRGGPPANPPDASGMATHFRKALPPPKDGRRTQVVEAIQDSEYRVRQLRDKLGPQPDNADPYLQMTLFHGRVGSRIEEGYDAATEIIHDANTLAKKTGTPLDKIREVVNYQLLVNHAPERNRVHGDGAAGISNALAANIKTQLASHPEAAEVQRIAKKITDLNGRTLDLLHQAQVLSDETYTKLHDTYQQHVPLNRIFDETADVGGALSGKGFDVRSTGLKKAEGSDRAIHDILGNVVSNYEQAVLRAEKNVVDLATLNFLRRNHQALANVARVVKVEPMNQDPRILRMYEDGKPVAIKFQDAKVASAFKGTNRDKVPNALRMVAVATRFYAGLATRFNPEFAAPNKIRDIQETAAYLASQKGMGLRATAKFIARDPQSIKDITDWMRGKDTPGSRLYTQMKEDGGTTGGMGLSTRDQVGIKLDKIAAIAQSNPRKALSAIIKGVDHWNGIFEDSTRLSVYKTALAQGMSRDRAAMHAKEASINFNRMGTASPIINALYMFSNASVQGTTKMMRAMRNPKTAAAVTAAVGASVFATNQWNDTIDPDWRDKVPKWDRQNALIVVLPGDGKGFKHMAIPVAWGVKPLKVMSDFAYDAAAGLSVDAKSFVSDFLGSVADGYNPLGGTDAISAATPTILDVPMDIARNKKWSGAPIRPDFDKYAPADTQYFRSLGQSATGQAEIKGTEMLRDTTGILMSPADVDYAVQQYIGGAGHSITRLVNSVSSLFTGKELPSKEYPFLSRFYRYTPNEELRKNADSGMSTDAQNAMADQSRARFYAKQNALDTYDKLTAMAAASPQEADAALVKLRRDDPETAKVIDKQLRTDQLGLNRVEAVIAKLGTNNGARARFIAGRIKGLSEEDQQLTLDTYAEKKLVTPPIRQQIDELLNGRDPATGVRVKIHRQKQPPPSFLH